MTELTIDTQLEGAEDGVVAEAPGARADVYNETHNTRFSAREVPWAKLGAVIDEPVDATEAARLGGLDFDIELYPAGFTKNGGKNYKRIQDRFAIVRGDTGEFFNHCSSEYGVVQYRDAFTFLDTINPQFVAAGSMRGGRVGFVVVKHPDVTALNGLDLNGVADPHELYVVVRTSQDLSYALEISLMSLRTVCMNELTMPTFSKDAPHKWSLRHSRTVTERMHQAAEVLTRAQTYQDKFADIARRLVDIDVDFEHARETLEYVLPNKPRRDKQIEEILDVYTTSPMNGFQGTGWGLVQGVSEYFEWERPGKPQTDATRLTNVLDGTTHQRIARTAQVLLAQAS